MKPKAFVLTDGLLMTDNAKTAHGLIRGTDRYEIVAILDKEFAGEDAGRLLDGKHRDISVMSDLEAAISFYPDVEFLIIGVATVGGRLPDNMMPSIELALENGISIVNGLHDYLSEKASLIQLAELHGAEIIDIRKPKSPKDLHFWTEDIFKLEIPIIAVMGTDCALGKRTTTRMIMEMGNAHGLNVQMIYTGQTGWLQGGKYGFILDATLNDFVSGELVYQILRCYEETKADIILIEGQSALRNPSGPCGLEFLLSANAKQVVLVHAPKRVYYEDEKSWGKIPSVSSEIEIIKHFGAEVIGLALNTHECSEIEALEFKREYEEALGIPVVLPILEGVKGFLDSLTALKANNE